MAKDHLPLIHVEPDAEALARYAATRIAAMVQPGFTIALSGGSTPRRTYELLRGAPLDWSQVEIFWGDERLVPPSHPESNEGMVRRALLDHVPVPPSNVHPLTAGVEPLLRTRFGEGSTFTLALQGLGEDGHTASIFPLTVEGDGWIVQASKSPSATSDPADRRLSLSLGVLARARLVVFLVTGGAKAEMVAEILRPNCDFPAARLLRMATRVEFWLDSAAASRLPENG